MKRSIPEMGKKLREYRAEILSKATDEVLNSLEVASDMLLQVPETGLHLMKTGDSWYATRGNYSGIGDTPSGAIENLGMRGKR